MLGAKGANDRVGAEGGDLPLVEVTAYGDSVVATDGRPNDLSQLK